mmetsp:Transcript_11091/g.26357  ORF Transcript_11091/g.26357 Transcript_11091/m.26357 type:complete len:98 (-) Transcript_11091:785-1078(-)
MKNNNAATTATEIENWYIIKYSMVPQEGMEIVLNHHYPEVIHNEDLGDDWTSDYLANLLHHHPKFRVDMSSWMRAIALFLSCSWKRDALIAKCFGGS